MAAWVTPVSVLRVPARMELWNWVTRSAPLSFARNSTISTPYAETTPMVALREYQVPKTQLDSSLFEASEEDEYRSVAESLKRYAAKSLKRSAAKSHKRSAAKSLKRSVTATTPVATNSSGLSSSLLRLVHQHDYASASRVRAEMIQHNLQITPDHAFIHPAIWAVKHITNPAVRLREFSEWLSLLPVAKDLKPRFDRLVYMFSSNPQVDVDLIMTFTLICVSKGYVAGVPMQMIPLVIRFARPSVSLQFIEDFGSAAVKGPILSRPHKGKMSFLGNRVGHKIRVLYKIAVAEYVRIGLVEEATKTAQMGSQYGLSLPAAAFERPPHRVFSRRYDVISEIPSALNPLGLDIGPSDQEALLSRVWENIRTVEPPDALDIAHFLEIFDLQPTIIQSLSTYNQTKPPIYRVRWILGEMLYYARRKEWRELIGVFDTYFFRIGVPGNIDEHKSRGRVTTDNVGWRLFPSPQHTSLVWMAVVELARGVRPVPVLFKELIDQATAAKTRDYARVGAPLINAPTEMFDAGHFGPFLVAAYRDRRLKRLVTVFDELSRMGIEPTLEQLSLLAGANAGRGQGPEAVRILDMMEGILKEKGINQSSGGHYSVSRIVALYLPALSWFITRKDAPGALLVRSRILGQGYVRGTYPYLDRKLAKLETPTVVRKR